MYICVTALHEERHIRQVHMPLPYGPPPSPDKSTEKCHPSPPRPPAAIRQDCVMAARTQPGNHMQVVLEGEIQACNQTGLLKMHRTHTHTHASKQARGRAHTHTHTHTHTHRHSYKSMQTQAHTHRFVYTLTLKYPQCLYIQIPI